MDHLDNHILRMKPPIPQNDKPSPFLSCIPTEHHIHHCLCCSIEPLVVHMQNNQLYLQHMLAAVWGQISEHLYTFLGEG